MLATRMSDAGSDSLYGVSGNVDGKITLAEIDLSTAALRVIGRFEVGSDVTPFGLTYHHPSGRFLILNGAAPASLVFLDTGDFTTEEVTIAGLPAGEEAVSGIDFNVGEDRIFVTFGSAGTFLENRICAVDPSGAVMALSGDLGLGDRDYVGAHSVTGALLAVDLNSTIPGVTQVDDVFGSPITTVIADPPPDSALLDPAFVPRGTELEFYTTRSSGGVTLERYTIAAGYETIGSYDCLSVGAITFAPTVPVPSFIRGDCNDDGVIQISDAVFGLSALFSGGDPPTCEDACDANDDGAVDIADMVFTLAFLFTSGPSPSRPFPACGSEVAGDCLSCQTFTACP